MFEQEKQKFSSMVLLLSNEMRYAEALSEVVSSPDDCGFLAKEYLKFTDIAGTSLNLAKHLISFELNKYKATPQSIFRSNSFPTKLLGNYTKLVGKQYLKVLLGPLLDDLIDENQSLEIDINKVRRDSNIKNPEEEVEKNLKHLQLWCDKFLDRMMSPEMINKIPLEVFFVCRAISEVADALELDTPVLIGSFMILRFINPAIATPQAYNLIDSSKLSPISLRNFILISKVIQNLANSTRKRKEQFMTLLETYTEQRQTKMRNYFSSILFRHTSKNINFAMNNYIPLEAINMDSYDKKPMLRMHCLLYKNAVDITKYIFNREVKLVKSVNTIMTSTLEFIVLLFDLQKVVNESDKLIAKPIEVNNLCIECQKTLIELIQERKLDINNTEFEKACFFYRSTINTSEGDDTVFILIMRRINSEILSQPAALLFHLIKTLGDDFGKPIKLVFDFTYQQFNSATMQSIDEFISFLMFVFSPELFTTFLNEWFLLCADPKVERAVNELVVDIQSQRPNHPQIPNIVHAESVKDLCSYLNTIYINIPQLSKNLPATSYRVKHKARVSNEREIIITPFSVFSFNPITKALIGIYNYHLLANLVIEKNKLMLEFAGDKSVPFILSLEKAEMTEYTTDISETPIPKWDYLLLENYYNDTITYSSKEVKDIYTQIFHMLQFRKHIESFRERKADRFYTIEYATKLAQDDDDGTLGLFLVACDEVIILSMDEESENVFKYAIDCRYPIALIRSISLDEHDIQSVCIDVFNEEEPIYITSDASKELLNDVKEMIELYSKRQWARIKSQEE
mmetsp:Transcript_9613/g.14193  ORF Transcript_9613/g.14193 Transcript_9613/m.14193 type:complete len:798 (+) Transcript_9613:69-2462(+)